MSDAPTPTDTIVLIHGLWMTPLSWEHWVERFAAQGFTVLAPSWPGLEGGVEALRKDPTPLEGLRIKPIVDHYDAIIRALPAPPILIGHSFGGLFVQLLADRGLGAAGVAIASAPPKGVLKLPFSTLKVNFPVLRNPANRNRAVPLTPKQFHYAFTNTMTDTESQAAYDRYHVPAAGRVLFEGAFANLHPHAPTKLNYANNERAPLLFIAGGVDHIIPPGLNQANVKKWRRSTAITDYVEVPGRNHFTAGQPGWEAVADEALSWATAQAAAR